MLTFFRSTATSSSIIVMMMIIIICNYYSASKSKQRYIPHVDDKALSPRETSS